jgi:hypothetical protein
MASFADFLATLDPDAGKRGRQFDGLGLES